MDFTGERYIPEKFGSTDSISQAHSKRYEFASSFVTDKIVVDIACGEGYGSNFLAQKAKTVLGIDIDKTSIQHANNKYLKDNLSFEVGSVVKILLPNNSVDIVISFETIEHVGHTEQKAFLTEIIRILKPGGICIISTPDKDIYGEGHNKFHIREMNKRSFLKQLNNYFKDVILYGQDCIQYRNYLSLFVMRIIHKLVKLDSYQLRHKLFSKNLRMNVNSNLSHAATSKQGILDKSREFFPVLLSKNETAMYLVAVCEK